MRNASLTMMSGWVSLLLLAVVSDAAFYWSYGQQRWTTQNPFGQGGRPVPTTRIPYSGQYRQPVPTTRQNNFDSLKRFTGVATTQKTFIRRVATNETQANSTFVYYLCRNGVCVRHYTAGFYSTVSVSGIVALLILSACVGAAVVVRRRQVAALHYSVISDADARPLLGSGRGLSIQSDPVLLARV